MLALAILFIAVGAGSIVLGCLDQRRLYWALEAWAHEQPNAREPSEQAYGIRRAGYLLAGMLCVMFGALAIDAHESAIADEMDVKSASETAARSLSGTWTADLGPFPSDIQAAVQEAHPDLEITERGDERYEVTNSRGQHPVCLTVSSRGVTNVVVSTDVSVGRC